MPLVYRIEDADTGKGPYENRAVDVLNFEARKHGRDLWNDMPPGSKVPGFDPERHVFGFSTVEQYERWTKHHAVRHAFAAIREVKAQWMDKARPVRFRLAVYDAPEVTATDKQAIFEKSKATLIESRSPAWPRIPNSFTPEDTNANDYNANQAVPSDREDTHENAADAASGVSEAPRFVA